MDALKARGVRKSIMDLAWSQFIEMTVSKAEEAGRRVILIDPRTTSKSYTALSASRSHH